MARERPPNDVSSIISPSLPHNRATLVLVTASAIDSDNLGPWLTENDSQNARSEAVKIDTWMRANLPWPIYHELKKIMD